MCPWRRHDGRQVRFGATVGRRKMVRPSLRRFMSYVSPRLGTRATFRAGAYDGAACDYAVSALARPLVILWSSPVLQLRDLDWGLTAPYRCRPITTVTVARFSRVPPATGRWASLTLHGRVATPGLGSGGRRPLRFASLRRQSDNRVFLRSLVRC